MPETVDFILENYNSATSEKDKYTHIMREAGKYAWPAAREMYRSRETSEGQEYSIDIFDSTAIDASFRLSANIFSHLMPVGTKWFEFKASDYQDNQESAVTEWLSKATSVTQEEMTRSNFMREMFSAIRSMIVFGTGIISVEKDSKTNELSYRSYHTGDIAFLENSKGDIDTVFRDIYYTARQAVQEFDRESLPAEIVKAAENPTEAQNKFKFIHCVYPNSDFTKKKITSKKFKSAFVYEDKRVIVKEGKFDSNPYLVMRFTKAPGELWGRGPVIELLPEIRMLNQMRFDFIESADLANNPPMIAEDDGVIGQPVTEPKGMIYIRAGASIPVPWNTGANLPLTNEVIINQQQIVKDGMLLNIFQTLEDVRNISSATESQIRKQEGLALVGAVVGAVQKDALDPLISRSLDLIPQTKLPDAPKEFDFDIIYQGRLSMAMSTLQADAIVVWLAQWAPYAELGVLENIDMDHASRISALASGVPAEVLTDADAVKQQREQIKQQQQQAMQLQNAEAGSKAVKNLSGKVDESSPLAQI